MVYSGVAAIHACLLVWVGPIDGELDQQALLAILGTSCIITVPLLNWSSRLRYIGRQKTSTEAGNAKGGSTRTVIVYWGFLVLVGFICILYSIWRDWVWGVNGSTRDSFTCSPEGKLDLSAGRNSSWPGLIPTVEFIEANNCLDQCHRAAPSFENAIFRSSDDLRLLDKTQVNMLLEIGQTKEERKAKAFSYYLAITFCVFPYILLQGFLTALFGRRRPSQIRDSVYLSIYPRTSILQKRQGS